MLQKVRPATAMAGRKITDEKARSFVNSQNTESPQAAIRAELAWSDTATALGIVARETSPVLALCRKLVAAGHPAATPLQAWRGDTLCLRVRSIGEAARLRVASHGSGFKPVLGRTGGPPIDWLAKADRKRGGAP